MSNSPARLNYIEPREEEETLVEVLDQLLDVGVVVSGDLKISVADVDLLYIGCKLVACSADKIATQPAIGRAFNPVKHDD
ncbi:MAG: gas vesicle protein [Pseudomonadota bacterium]